MDPTNTPSPKTNMQAQDREILRSAMINLEDISFLIKVADFIGTPIEKILDTLPPKASSMVNKASDKAMRKTLDIAISSLKDKSLVASPKKHKFASAVSGALGGATGFAGLAIELPITTTIIFRSIADIARSEGCSLEDPQTYMECLQIFALGSPGNPADDGSESAYLGARFALAASMQEAAVFMAKSTLASEAPPALIKFITSIANRFGIVVSYKAAAQFAPVIGAVGGAALNTFFMDHFQNIARSHFTIRRLEKKYGQAVIESEYLSLMEDAYRRGDIKERPTTGTRRPTPPPPPGKNKPEKEVEVEIDVENLNKDDQ